MYFRYSAKLLLDVGWSQAMQGLSAVAASSAAVAPLMTTQPMLPMTGTFRNLMRATENQALQEQRQRAAGLDHATCSELAQAESALLVDMEAAMSDAAAGGSSELDTPQARELLRAPLDGLAAQVRGLLAAYFDDEAASVKRAVAGVSADMASVHEKEGRRARDAIKHVKAQFNVRLESTRRAAKEEMEQAKAELRRDCEARVQQAERRMREAESIAAAAVETHPTIDAEAWRNERAHLRVRVELLEKQLNESTSESSEKIRRLNEARINAERQAAASRTQLRLVSDKLEVAVADLRHVKDLEARASSANSALELKLAELTGANEQLRTSLRAAQHRARSMSEAMVNASPGRSATSSPTPGFNAPSARTPVATPPSAAPPPSKFGSGRCAYSLDAHTQRGGSAGSGVGSGVVVVGTDADGTNAAAAMRDHTPNLDHTTAQPIGAVVSEVAPSPAPVRMTPYNGGATTEGASPRPPRCATFAVAEPGAAASDAPPVTVKAVEAREAAAAVAAAEVAKGVDVQRQLEGILAPLLPDAPLEGSSEAVADGEDGDCGGGYSDDRGPSPLPGAASLVAAARAESARAAARANPIGHGRAQSARAQVSFGMRTAEMDDENLAVTVTPLGNGMDYGYMPQGTRPTKRAQSAANYSGGSAALGSSAAANVSPPTSPRAAVSDLSSGLARSVGPRAGSPVHLQPRPPARVTAVNRQPCASLPYTLRPSAPTAPPVKARQFHAPESMHGNAHGVELAIGAAVEPAECVADGSGVGGSAGGSARGSICSSNGGGGGLSRRATSASPRAPAAPVARLVPPPSLVDKMRMHQANLATLVQERSHEAMSALAHVEKHVVPTSQRAETSAAVRSAAARRAKLEDEAMQVVMDGQSPMDLWLKADSHAAVKKASPRGAKREVERTVKTYVGLNFVR